MEFPIIINALKVPPIFIVQTCSNSAIGYISDDRPSNDRTTDYRSHIIALFYNRPV